MISKRKRKQDHMGFILILISLSVLAGIGYLYHYASSTHIPVDSSFCPVNQPPSQITAIIIDQTDPFTPIQAEHIKTELNTIRSSIPRYGQLMIFVVKSSDNIINKPVFSLCNPGSPEDVNEWTESAKNAKSVWEESFQQPLTSKIDNLIPKDSKDKSPIIETIQAASVQAFSGKDASDTSKELIIVSDLLQNSAELSHYRMNGDYKSGPDTYFSSTQSELQGVDLQLLYLRRQKYRQYQGGEHIRWWQDYIEQNGGRVVRVQSISG